ncbi:MAG: oligosaccharide flippase family protein [Kofleriaceae bacterium]
MACSAATVPPSDSRRMSSDVNRGLAWIGVASSLIGVLDIVAILLILNLWVTTEEFGIATKCIWIFPILDQATDLGLSAAVIQRDDHSEAVISTVFWINLAVALCLFAMLLVAAPLLATHLYGHAIVGWMLIAYGTKLLWQNVYFIPLAMMKRELRFKELSVIRVVANLAEFFGKVGFAWAGFGIWCFVLGPLARVLVTGIGAQLRHPYRPKLVLRPREAKEYVTFGLKSSASQILFYFYTNIDFPIVGYYFGDVALGLYRLGTEIVLEPVRILSNIIVDIAFPAFAKLRHNRDRLIAQFVSFTKLNMIIVMSYSAIVFVAAPDLMGVFFPEYHGSASVVRVLCIVAIFRAISFVLPPLLDGFGRPDRTFTYTATAAVVMPIAFSLGAILLGDSLGFVSVAIAWAIGYPIAWGILLYLAIYTIKWSVLAYLRAVVGVAACIVGAALAAAGVHYLCSNIPPSLRLLATAITVVGVAGVLLAYTQGLSLRTAKRAMSADD